MNCREIVIDLTSKAPTGLDGIIKVLLLQDDQKKLSSSVELEEDSFYCQSLDEELHDRLEQRIGYIEHVHIDYSEKDDSETESYSTSYYSMGRWSQQGFRIESPLFVEYNDRYKVQKLVPSSIHYPFVVYYDLDLSADFMINLTVDRMRFVQDEKFENIKRHICEVISTLLFEELGKKEVMNSQEFFKEIVEEIGDKAVKNTFELCLERMLGE